MCGQCCKWQIITLFLTNWVFSLHARGQITAILSSLKQCCQLLPTRWDVIAGCVNVPSSHYSTYLTSLSPTGAGFYLFAAFSPDFTLPSLFRCHTAGDRSEDPDFNVVLPSATAVWARLPKILHSGTTCHTLWFSPALTFDWRCPLGISTLDLINSPLTVFVCWALLSPSTQGKSFGRVLVQKLSTYIIS